MISNQTITNLCRDCNGSFEVEVSYNELGATTSFIPKYCPECNKKPKLTGPNGSWGTVNIESAKVPQRNVEGLEESLQTLATSIVNDRSEFRAFKKHIEHDIEQNTDKITETREALHSTINLTFEHGRKIDELNKQNQNRFAEINDLEHNLNVFKSSQAEFNTKQSDFNISVLQLVKEIHKTLIVGFSLFVILMLVTWGYLTYTHFKH